MRLWILKTPNEVLDVNKLHYPTKNSSVISSYKTTTFSLTGPLSTTSSVFTTTVSLPLQQRSILPTTPQKIPLSSSSTVPNVRSTQAAPTATEEPETGVYLLKLYLIYDARQFNCHTRMS